MGGRASDGAASLEFHRIDPTRDRDRLRRFLARCDPEDYLLHGLPEWIREGRLWIATEDREWVAFGRLHDLGAGEGWLSGFRVDPQRLRQRIGFRLLRVMVADARSVGIHTLRAVIEDGNVASRGLFLKSGARAAFPLTLRCGAAGPTAETLLHRATSGESLDGPVGWLPSTTGFVDLLPGAEGGRFGRWRAGLIDRWVAERKLFLGPGLAAAVQLDWWDEPRTLWVQPLRGEPRDVVAALGQLTRAMQHAQWQAFLPSTDELRAQYDGLSLTRHPMWGDRVQVYELRL
jgi:N-acetylglutamate synthase-like GNAT family acetyltransferase